MYLHAIDNEKHERHVSNIKRQAMLHTQSKFERKIWRAVLACNPHDGSNTCVSILFFSYKSGRFALKGGTIVTFTNVHTFSHSLLSALFLSHYLFTNCAFKLTCSSLLISHLFSYSFLLSSFALRRPRAPTHFPKLSLILARPHL
jgi:hypothetical protein